MARSAEGLPTKPKRKVKPKAKRKRKTTHVRKQNGQGAPVGNQFWKMRSSFGRLPDYKPDTLWAAACEYFEWTDANPLVRIEVGKSGDTFGQQVSVPVKRPYTISALCLFLDIDRQTFTNYSEGIGYKDYFAVCATIRETIYHQKYEGAASGFFNPAIIARDLGLVDRQERDIGNKAGEPFKTASVTAEITPDMDEKTASQIYRSLLNPPKQDA